MGAAFLNWFKRISVVKIVQSVVDGLVVETETAITFEGVIQPLSPEKIELKPEGQRSWVWLQIHCKAGSLNLNDNDKIVYNGNRLKVMGKLDYSLNGFVEYHAVQDYPAQE